MTTEPAIGVDEWVARAEDRRVQRGGLLGGMERATGRVPWAAWLALFIGVCCLLPVATSDGYVRRVAFDTALYVLLALGLNVVVGWGGLLDLGYVAFYGFGAYAYALLSSAQFHVHAPTIFAIPIVVAATATLGFLLGLTSWRLVGDYLAIVTLFFGQIFLTVVVNGDKVFGQNVSGGTQGISNLDSLSLFGHALPVSHAGIFNVAYLYVALGLIALVYAALRFVNHSRTGRAWRALREDPLAAELMSMPVDRLKLLAFAFGAGTAGLTGSLFASLNAGVFPENFALPLLITIYAMVILGGAGSQAGVVLGAILVNVMLEALRSEEHARWLFYGVVLVVVLAFLRPRVRGLLVVGATAGLGFAAHAIAHAIHSSWTTGTVQGSDAIARAAGHWVVVPTHLGKGQAISYILLIAAVLFVSTLKGWARLAALVPTLYLAAFVWENVMALKPESTRFVILGALLVGVMTTRPAGLLGEARVEIV